MLHAACFIGFYVVAFRRQVTTIMEAIRAEFADMRLRQHERQERRTAQYSTHTQVRFCVGWHATTCNDRTMRQTTCGSICMSLLTVLQMLQAEQRAAAARLRVKSADAAERPSSPVRALLTADVNHMLSGTGPTMPPTVDRLQSVWPSCARNGYITASAVIFSNHSHVAPPKMALSR